MNHGNCDREIMRLLDERAKLLVAVKKLYAEGGQVWLGNLLKELGEEDRWGVVAGYCTAENYEEWSAENALIR